MSKCKHEWRLAEHYESNYDEEDVYVYYCIHCLSMVRKQDKHCKWVKDSQNLNNTTEKDGK